jgi:hypothetical protein
VTLKAALIRKDGSVSWVELPVSDLTTPRAIDQDGVKYTQLSLTQVVQLVGVYFEG